jgi:hypothetical protein
MRGPLRSHRSGRLDGEDISVRGFVVARTGANIQHRPRAAERGMKLRGDSRIGAAHARVSGSMDVVVDVSEGGSHACSRISRITA